MLISTMAINKATGQVKNKEDTQEKKERHKHKTENGGMMTLPYVRGVTERIQRAMKKYNIYTPVKSRTKLQQLLVHPKDKIEPNNKCNVIYEIPCQLCNKTDTVETGRSFNTQRKEHKKECEKETEKRQARLMQEKAQVETYKPAIMERCKRENHVMDWDKARVIHTEDNKHQHWIREAIEIRKRGPGTREHTCSHTLIAASWRGEWTAGHQLIKTRHTHQ